MITYLASPYTAGGGTLQDRVDAACKAAAYLMAKGHRVFAPVPHSHFIADHLHDDVRFDHEFWMEQDLAVLQECGLLLMLTYPGFDTSRGMRREVAEAERLGIPIGVLDWNIVKDWSHK